jgi:4-phosphopantoate--beta-alanine ligase
MKQIPKSHPRYHSLMMREQMVQAMNHGLVHETGLIAHGRGEAFDYLLGEKSPLFADRAAKVAAAALLNAAHPVISVNGNVAALVPKACVRLAKCVSAGLEVNLFHRTQRRITKIISVLQGYGAEQVFGLQGDARIPGLDHDRGVCDRTGIFAADVVFVMLEDGDRCQALRNMGKLVIAVDLNPLSRTAQIADITIVDNVIRAVPAVAQWADKEKSCDKEELTRMIDMWDNQGMLREVMGFLSKRLNSLF